MTLVHFLIGIVAILLALSLVMTLAWLIEQRSGNAGWIDTVWTFGLGTVGIASALIALPSETSLTQRQALVAGLVLLWSLRLGIHIASRSAGRTDDPRYAKLRQQWGDRASAQMWILLQKQALVSLPLGLAIWLAAHQPGAGLRVQDYLAVLILAVAIGGEAVADRQLRRFLQDHAQDRNAVCDAGLWSWSRHPNYFFEWFGWLAYALIAIDVGGAYPFGWFALAGPACMYWLLVYVSGIPPLEAHMVRTRGDAFRAYRARTSAFFPLPPRIKA